MHYAIKLTCASTGKDEGYFVSDDQAGVPLSDAPTYKRKHDALSDARHVRDTWFDVKATVVPVASPGPNHR